MSVTVNLGSKGYGYVREQLAQEFLTAMLANTKSLNETSKKEVVNNAFDLAEEFIKVSRERTKQ